MNEKQPVLEASGVRPLAVRIPEAIRLTGMGKTKLYSLIASGDLTIAKIGRVTLIPLSSLEALVERSSTGRQV